MTKHKPIPPIIDHNDTACMILGAYADKENQIAAEKAATEKAKQAARQKPLAG